MGYNDMNIQDVTAIYKEIERFEKKFIRSDSCWIWCGGKWKNGYGQFYLHGGKQAIPAHRYSYELYKGNIPKGLVIDHLCRRRDCVNPEHLEAVTQQVNILRGEGLAAKQAQQTHCKRGHSLVDAHILSRGRRDCRTCRKIRNDRRTTEYRKVHG